MPQFEPSVKFPLTVDGVACRTFEIKHPDQPKAKEYSCHKFGKKAGLTYELGIAAIGDQLSWIAGPFPGGCPDSKIFKESGLQQILVDNDAEAIADKGYKGLDGISITTRYDMDFVKEYKRRLRGRHESFNGHIKKFEILNQAFRHKKDRLQKHQTVFEAICIICQYEMENGFAIFSA